MSFYSLFIARALAPMDALRSMHKTLPRRRVRFPRQAVSAALLYRLWYVDYWGKLIFSKKCTAPCPLHQSKNLLFRITIGPATVYR